MEGCIGQINRTSVPKDCQSSRFQSFCQNTLFIFQICLYNTKYSRIDRCSLQGNKVPILIFSLVRFLLAVDSPQQVEDEAVCKG